MFYLTIPDNLFRSSNIMSINAIVWSLKNNSLRKTQYVGYITIKVFITEQITTPQNIFSFNKQSFLQNKDSFRWWEDMGSIAPAHITNLIKALPQGLPQCPAYNKCFQRRIILCIKTFRKYLHPPSNSWTLNDT